MGKVLFIGKFSKTDALSNIYSSAAGNIVQREIIKSLSEVVVQVECIVMEPQKIWPAGLLIHKEAIKEDIKFIGYVNLPIIKNLIFSYAIYRCALKFKPSLIIQYNSYLFENLSMLFFSVLFKAKTCLVIQDIRIGKGFTFLAQIHDQISNSLIRFFSLVIPITDRIAKDLNLKNFITFQGGITEEGFGNLESSGDLKNIAVFAGALEPYNGINRVIDFWLEHDTGVDLHIFGRGTLSDMALKASKRSARINYHGFSTSHEVAQWQKSSKFNFCLRFSDGIEEEYFFPSKFFNAACAPGVLIVNKFKNIPNYMIENGGLWETDEDLIRILSFNEYETYSIGEQRRAAVRAESTWVNLVQRLVSKLRIK